MLNKNLFPKLVLTPTPTGVSGATVVFPVFVQPKLPDVRAIYDPSVKTFTLEDGTTLNNGILLNFLQELKVNKPVLGSFVKAHNANNATILSLLLGQRTITLNDEVTFLISDFINEDNLKNRALLIENCNPGGYVSRLITKLVTNGQEHNRFISTWNGTFAQGLLYRSPNSKYGDDVIYRKFVSPAA